MENNSDIYIAHISIPRYAQGAPKVVALLWLQRSYPKMLKAFKKYIPTRYPVPYLGGEW